MSFIWYILVNFEKAFILSCYIHLRKRNNQFGGLKKVKVLMSVYRVDIKDTCCQDIKLFCFKMFHGYVYFDVCYSRANEYKDKTPKIKTVF